jgi:hypothetical protein
MGIDNLKSDCYAPEDAAVYPYNTWGRSRFGRHLSGLTRLDANLFEGGGVVVCLPHQSE